MNRLGIYQTIVNGMEETYKAKNSDYGNSVGDTFEKFGDVSFITRISDKYNRILSLTMSDDVKVKDEKLEDTILDLANYCILWLVEREYANQEKNEVDVDVTATKPSCNDATVAKMMEEETAKRINDLSKTDWDTFIGVMDVLGIVYHLETIYAGPSEVKFRLVANSLSDVNRALDIVDEIK